MVMEKIDARCMECSEVKKGFITSTGNFKTHYKSKHPGRFKALEEYLKGSNSSNGTAKVKQPTMPQVFASTVSPENVRLQVIFLFLFQLVFLYMKESFACKIIN